MLHNLFEVSTVGVLSATLGTFRAVVVTSVDSHTIYGYPKCHQKPNLWVPLCTILVPIVEHLQIVPNLAHHRLGRITTLPLGLSMLACVASERELLHNLFEVSTDLFRYPYGPAAVARRTLPD